MSYLLSWSINLETPIALNAASFQLSFINQLTLTRETVEAYDVTMFHPIRPSVRWSRVEKRLATIKGLSKLVDVVIANERFLVTAAIAEIGILGSIIGHWAPRLMHSSIEPSYTACPAVESARKRAFMLPRSRSWARFVQYDSFNLVLDLSFGFWF